MKTLLTLSILIFALTACNQPQSETRVNEILWDNWGVPHIYAGDDESLYYGFGRAQMESHGDLLVKLYSEARGKASEYWGEDFLEIDKLGTTLGIFKKAQTYYSSIPANEKLVVDAFTNGLNAFAKDNPEHISEKFRVALPIQPVDIIAHTFRVFYIEFMANRELGKVPGWMAGSNTWAVAPKRSASGNALLLANPHLPWFDFWLFYEAHLISGDKDIYGATLIGLPNIGIGFNKNLGWSHTVNTIDHVDLFEVEIEGGHYSVGDVSHKLVTNEVILKVKQEDGSFREENITVSSTVHGPVIGQKDGKHLAIGIAHYEAPSNMLTQWKAMGEATNLEEFQAALKLNQLPMFNVMYADKAGNIFYHFGGHVPKRQHGDWDYWSGIVSGNDQKNNWEGYHAYEDMPQLLNPENGWMQNANDPPYTNTVPTALNPDDYPAYMAPNRMSFRPQRSANLMVADESISFDEFVEYKHSTVMELAERLVDDLLALTDKADSPVVKEALEVFAQWDKKAETDSKGAVLFANWYLKASGGNPFGQSVFAEKWQFENPNQTPDGIKDSAKALKVLEVAAEEVKSKYGRLDIPWGDVYRVKGGNFDHPANGGMGWLGEFRTVWFQPDGDKFTAFHGDTYVAAIEFGETPRAKVLLSYGNATQPGNKHIGDQLEMFSKKQMRDAFLDRETIESNLEKKEVYEIGTTQED
ncbi:MAG: acylase [Bacteroidota bacterium]